MMLRLRHRRRDDNKLKTCTAWKSVRYCNMLHARRSIDQNTNDHARKDSLNYMTKFCTSSLLAATMVIAPLFIALSATDPSSSIAMACCSNMICVGFDDANQMREMKESLHPTCTFWRRPLPELHEEANMNAMKRKR